MGNKRQRKIRKTISSRAMSKRRKNETPENPPMPPVRVIVSTKAIENLLNLVAAHSQSCKNPSFMVDGNNPQLLHITCRSCGKLMKARKDSPESHSLPVSEGFAAGALCAGIGHTVIKTLCAALEIPVLCKATYLAAEEKVGHVMEKVMHASFKKNGTEERRLAIEVGDQVKADGINYAFINVTVDGGWAKRSYGHSYNSNAGVGVIIGIISKT